MTINELKSCLTQCQTPKLPIIFKVSDTDFIAHQYIDYMKETFNKTVEITDNMNSAVTVSSDIFSLSTQNTSTIYVFKIDTLTENEMIYPVDKYSNVIVICKTIKVDIDNSYIVSVPKIEKWQIQDYVYSLASGIDTTNLDNLIDICGNDLYRLEQEVSKIKIFAEIERKSLFNDFLYDGVFSDLSKYSVFDFTNCIMQKDINKLSVIYKELDRIDIEPIGLVTILIKNFRNVIKVQLNNNPTTTTTGLTDKQIWAVKKYNCGFYNKEQLLRIYQMLTSMDMKLKTGYIGTERMIDYVVTFILSI